MAQRGLNDTHYDWLRNLYFGNLWRERSAQWWYMLRQLATFEVSTTSTPSNGVYFVCNRQNNVRGDVCNDDRVAASSTPLNSNYVTFIVICNSFWERFPSHNPWFPNKIWWGEIPEDWPTLIAHELTSAGSLVGDIKTTNVPDKSWYSWFLSAGLSKEGLCYRFSCCIALAEKGIFDGGDWGGHNALENAQNWAFYLKSIRDCYDGSYNGNLACWVHKNGD